MTFKGFISPKFTLKVRQASDTDLVEALHVIAEELARRRERGLDTRRAVVINHV